MTLLVSRTAIPMPNAAAVAEALIGHLAEHDVICVQDGARATADLGVGTGVIEATADALKVRVEAKDLSGLEMLRAFVAEHVEEFSGGPVPTIVWKGNATAGKTLSGFCEARLVSAVDLTPRMRRLTFSGEGIGRFAAERELHLRMYFPPEGVNPPEWPRPGPDGRIIWPAEDRRPAVRYYTVRRAGASADQIDIDFLIHDDAGPGCAFALNAKAGAVCGMAGPVGKPAQAAPWTLLAGDETALPAIARMLEEMPADASGAAFLEVEDATDEIEIARPSGVSLGWVHRRAGETLVEAVKSVSWPDVADPYAWVASETSAVEAIRSHLRAERAMPRDRHLVVGYWEREAA